MVAFCPHSCFLSEYSVAVAVQTFHSQRLEVGSKSFFLSSVCLLFGEKSLSQKSLTYFFSHLIRRYWFTSLGSLAKGNGVSSAWVGYIVSPKKIMALLGREREE